MNHHRPHFALCNYITSAMQAILYEVSSRHVFCSLDVINHRHIRTFFDLVRDMTSLWRQYRYWSPSHASICRFGGGPIKQVNNLGTRRPNEPPRSTQPSIPRVSKSSTDLRMLRRDAVSDNVMWSYSWQVTLLSGLLWDWSLCRVFFRIFSHLSVTLICSPSPAFGMSKKTLWA